MHVSDLTLRTSSGCGCTSARIKSCGIMVGLFDLTVLTALFVKCFDFFKHQGYNSFSLAALVTCTCFYVIHLFCVVGAWHGIAASRSLWLVPEIVLKGVTAGLTTLATASLAYFVLTDFSIIGRLIAQNSSWDYFEEKATVDMAALVGIALGGAFSMAQFWLLLLLVHTYSTIRIKEEQITLDQINAVVITHAHPGVMGNLNFFGQKPVLFHSLEFIGRHVMPTELKDRPYRKLSQNIEVWKTPGHTQHDLTVLVHGVAGYGTMAISGDLIPNEQLIAEKRDILSDEGVWDSAIKRQNANLIVCMADWIVPGHGTPFRVLPHYRQKAGCTRLLAQRYSLNA